MTQNQIRAVKESWAKVETLDPIVVGGLFYTRLFEIMPELASMFRSPIPEQSKKLIAMIGYVIHKLDKLDTILDEVGRLAERHVQYGVKNEHYAVVGGALLWTLEKGLGSEWNEQLKECWGICYQLLSDAMIQAGERSSRAA